MSICEHKPGSICADCGNPIDELGRVGPHIIDLFYYGKHGERDSSGADRRFLVAPDVAGRLTDHIKRFPSLGITAHTIFNRSITVDQEMPPGSVSYTSYRPSLSPTSLFLLPRSADGSAAGDPAEDAR